MITRSSPWLIICIIIQGAILVIHINQRMIICNADGKIEHISDNRAKLLGIAQDNVTSDFIAPFITSPADVSYLVNTTGHTIAWYIADKNPGNYSILHNYRYIDTERNHTWLANQTVIYSIDNLSIGIHLFSILVEDLNQNTFSDEVFVTVLEKAVFPTFTETSTTSDDHPGLFEEYFTYGLGLAVLILVSVIIVGGRKYRKRLNLPLKLPPEDPLELELLDEKDIL